MPSPLTLRVEDFKELDEAGQRLLEQLLPVLNRWASEVAESATGTQAQQPQPATIQGTADAGGLVVGLCRNPLSARPNAVRLARLETEAGAAVTVPAGLSWRLLQGGLLEVRLGGLVTGTKYRASLLVE